MLLGFLHGSFFKVFVRWVKSKNFPFLEISLWLVMFVISNLGWCIWIIVKRIFSWALSVFGVWYLEEVTLGVILQKVDLSKAFCRFCIFRLMALMSTYKILWIVYISSCLSSVSLYSLSVSIVLILSVRCEDDWLVLCQCGHWVLLHLKILVVVSIVVLVSAWLLLCSLYLCIVWSCLIIICLILGVAITGLVCLDLIV